MKRVAILLLLASSAFGQQLSETVSVEVVQIPVYVVAADGTPVRGLKKDAFQLFIDGFPKPIEYFDPVDVTVRTGEEHRAERERRLYLLVFDLSCSREDCQGLPGRISRAQRGAASAVAQSNLDTDLFAVATYTANHGIQFATPFLRDRAAIRRAIATLSSSAARDPLGLAMSPAEQTVWTREETADMTDEARFALIAGNDSASKEIAATLIGGIANQDNVREPIKHVVSDEFANLAALAARLGALEGQKHVVFFSQGFKSELVHGPGTKPDINGPTGFDSTLMNLMRDMTQAFQGAGVFLDAVDIAGLRNDADTAFNNDSLQMLAHGTGGEFVKNQNDFTAAISSLTRRQEMVYLLGFDRHDLMRGTVLVRVRGVPRGTHVTYREGFGAPPQRHEVDPLQLADIVVNDLPQTGVRMKIGLKGSSVVVALARNEIVPQLVPTASWTETILYVFDHTGAAVLTRQKRVFFDEEMRKPGGPIVIAQEMELPPGEYVAKAVTRIGGTASVGFARLEFVVE